jgi:hypothetical protein
LIKAAQNFQGPEHYLLKAPCCLTFGLCINLLMISEIVFVSVEVTSSSAVSNKRASYHIKKEREKIMQSSDGK